MALAYPESKYATDHWPGLIDGCCMGATVATVAAAYACVCLQAEARLAAQRGVVEEAEAAVQEALRRLQEAQVMVNVFQETPLLPKHVITSCEPRDY